MKTISEKIEISDADIDEQIKREERKLKLARFELNKTTLGKKYFKNLKDRAILVFSKKRRSYEVFRMFNFLIKTKKNISPVRQDSKVDVRSLNFPKTIFC